MATVPASRPDLAAHREALRLSVSQIVKQLVALIGRKLTAYVGGVRDVRAVDRWMNGSELYGDAEQRLRFAFQLVRMLAEKEDPTVIQSWLTGLNPELGDRVPLRLMRENDLETVSPEIATHGPFLIGLMPKKMEPSAIASTTRQVCTEFSTRLRNGSDASSK